jgi:hypothetical protein
MRRGGLRWGLCAVLTFVYTLAMPRVAHAQISTADVDQVLAALAQVVKDRATRIASRALREKVVSKLCGSKWEDDGQPLAALGVRGEVLRLGGTKGCRLNHGSCDANDVFVASCRDALKQNLELNDPHFLKDLGVDAVGFSVRLAASNLSSAEYDELRLGAVAQFLYAEMAAMSRSNPSIADLTQPLDVLADAMDTKLPSDALEAVGKAPATTTLLQGLQKIMKHACVGAGPDAKTTTCTEFRRGIRYYFSDDLFGTPDRKGAACTQLFTPAEMKLSGDAFKSIFYDDPNNARYADAPCEGMAGGHECQLAHTLFGVGVSLEKAYCYAYSTDAQRDFRNVVYALSLPSDLAAYREALASDPTCGTALNSLSLSNGGATPQGAEVARLVVADLPREDIAAGLRLFETALVAYQNDPSGLRSWLQALAATLPPTDLAAFLDSPALGWAHESGLSPSVAALRDAVKTFVIVPRFRVVDENDVLAGSKDQVQTAVASILRQLTYLGQTTETYQSSLSRLVMMMHAYADVAISLESWPGIDKSQQNALEETLDDAGDLLDLASRRDWVGIAMDVDTKLSGMDLKGLETSLRFVRILLSAYQASSPDEAKAVLESALEDESSREQRWHSFTIDAGALLGGHGGPQWNIGGPKVGDGWIAGLYAPFGIQLARRCLGLMIYPIDLGSYLVGDTNGLAPTPSSAVRIGGAAYLRPSAVIPIDVGFGSDYRPAFDDGRQEVRFTFFAAMELPLYQLQ